MTFSSNLISATFVILGVVSAITKSQGENSPLDPVLVAKLATALFGVQGLVNVLCTEASLKAYCPNSSTTLEDVIIFKSQGYLQLSIVVTAFLLVFYDADIDVALAYGLVPGMIAFATYLIDGIPDKIGIKSTAYKSTLVVYSVLVYGLLTNASWAAKAYKLTIGFATLRDVIQRVDPNRGFKMYGGTKENPIEAGTAWFFKGMSETGICRDVQALALCSGVDVLTSIGYPWALGILFMTNSLFVEKSFDQVKVDTSPFYPWYALCFVVAGTLVF